MGPYAAARHRRMFLFFVSDNGTMIISCWKTLFRLGDEARACHSQVLSRVSVLGYGPHRAMCYLQRLLSGAKSAKPLSTMKR